MNGLGNDLKICLGKDLGKGLGNASVIGGNLAFGMG